MNSRKVTPPSCPARGLVTRLAGGRPPSVLYGGRWQRQLRGPVGTMAISPHIRATRDTELADLRADVRQLVASHRRPHTSIDRSAIADREARHGGVQIPRH
jgi:hypothetical protein